MSFLKGVAGALISPLGAGLFGLFGKKKDPPRQLGPATRDDARELADRDKELRKRQGAAADRISGASGEPIGGFGNMIKGS